MDLTKIIGSLMADGSALEEMAKKVGAHPQEIQKAAGVGIPTLVAALNKNAQDEKEKASLSKALDAHSNDPVDNVSGFLKGVDLADGQKMLGHILGKDKTKAETNIAKSSGLSSTQVSSLLSMLAPVLLGALGQKKKEENIQEDNLARLTGSLGGLLSGSASGGLMDVAKKMLDKDKDGSALDDLLGGFFKKK